MDQRRQMTQNLQESNRMNQPLIECHVQAQRPTQPMEFHATGIKEDGAHHCHFSLLFLRLLRIFDVSSSVSNPSSSTSSSSSSNSFRPAFVVAVVAVVVVVLVDVVCLNLLSLRR